MSFCLDKWCIKCRVLGTSANSNLRKVPDEVMKIFPSTVIVVAKLGMLYLTRLRPTHAEYTKAKVYDVDGGYPQSVGRNVRCPVRVGNVQGFTSLVIAEDLNEDHDVLLDHDLYGVHFYMESDADTLVTRTTDAATDLLEARVT